MARILLVDDDPATLDVLDFAFQLEGHETTTAVDGQEGLEAAVTVLPDLIVLDSMMPRMDGLTAARLIRETAELDGIPIIMLTAKAMSSDIWAGWQAGVDSYITKPLDLDVLRSEMARIGIAAPAPILAGVA
ncbi:MAG: response regulator [Actinobacteria bacterium]|nr:response regulator [Actinomycetota bacterium]